MKHREHEKVKIDATTGEVYTTYPRSDKNAPGLVGRMFAWFARQVEKHLERTIQLRVYDDRRFNPTTNSGGDR